MPLFKNVKNYLELKASRHNVSEIKMSAISKGKCQTIWKCQQERNVNDLSTGCPTKHDNSKTT